MKRLEKFLRPYRRESILAPLFKLLEVVFDLMVPVVVAQIIDVGVAKNDRGYIVEMFFVLLLMAAVDRKSVRVGKECRARWGP